MTSTSTSKFRPYYTLLTFEADTGKWYPQWGSYSRSEVVAECEDYRREYKAKHLRIVAVDDDSMASVENLLVRLNGAAA